MSHKLSETLLAEVSEFVGAQMGLCFPPERWRDLERGIAGAAREFGFEDTESCVRWLLASSLTRKQVEILASSLTVGETYFFREKHTFEVLETRILPELIRFRQGSDRRLRIWSAGCCTGEEPYSIAILLHKLIPDLKNWNITVLATDINPHFLQKSAEGVYGNWSFRDTPDWVRERYFEKTKEGRFRVIPPVKRLVQFSYLNLADDTYPSLCNNTNGMDVIFCRNVLMYFGPETAKRTIGNLYRSLVEEGWLIVSSTEASHVLFSGFLTVHSPGAILYRKGSRREPNTDNCFLRLQEGPTVWPPPSPLLVTGTRQEEPGVFQNDGLLPAVVEETKDAGGGAGSYQNSQKLYQQGHYAEAEEELIASLAQNPENVGAMELLVRVYANQGRLAEALEWSQRAISANKLNAGGYYLRSTILQEQGAVAEARISLQRTLYLEPKFVLAHFTLGSLALRQGKAKEAEKHFENALSLLGSYRPEELLPESEGVTAGRLTDIIQSSAYRKKQS